MLFLSLVRKSEHAILMTQREWTDSAAACENGAKGSYASYYPYIKTN